jgi:hypothetical protein
MKNLYLEELRAIRALLPQFRRDQTKQLEFIEALDARIEDMVRKVSPLRLCPPAPGLNWRIFSGRARSGCAAGSGAKAVGPQASCAKRLW